MSDGTLTLDLRKSFRWRGTEGLIHGQNISGAHHLVLDTKDSRGEDGQVIGEVEQGHLSLDTATPLCLTYKETTNPNPFRKTCNMPIKTFNYSLSVLNCIQSLMSY